MKPVIIILLVFSFCSLAAQTNNVQYTRDWGTYFAQMVEGEERFEIEDIDTDANGNIWLVGAAEGLTATTDFITSDAYQSDPGNGEEIGFIVKFSSEGSLLYGSFFGGTMKSRINTISIKGNGVYIAGETHSATGVTTPGAYDEILTVNTDPNGNPITGAAFLAKFNDLGILQWATYYQGNRADGIYDVKAGYDNDFYIWGSTTSSNLATPGAFRENIPDPLPDGAGGLIVPLYPFLARFSTSGEPLWTTYYSPDLPPVGNFASNIFQGMAVDTNGNVYVGGFSQDTEGYYGTLGAHQPFGAGNGDFFVGKFSPSGQRLWGTYFGGPEAETIGSIAIPRNKLIISGLTNSSTNIATPGTWQDSFDVNSTNSFVTKFDL
ncbi:MAG TPA: SBBP repeat-containing protein, partial [Flavobacteriaceae bacterium]|nr:SBBP repeat-containing protein [Flavobacteriaceae bacterium]